MQRKSKKYVVDYWTGWGIREIWSHTIKTYPISVRADSIEEALPKILKKAERAYSYNTCFEEKGRVPIIEISDGATRSGILWLQDKSIAWEGQKVYSGFLSFDDVRVSKVIVTTPAHTYDWFEYYIIKQKFASYKQIFEYIWDYFGGNGNKISLFSDQNADLNKYFFKQLESFIKNKIIPEDEIESLKNLLEQKKNCVIKR